MWGSLNTKQHAIVASYVAGKTVHDLGAGDLKLSKILADMGADVVAVEPNTECFPAQLPKNIKIVPSYFNNFRGPVDMAFMSWPSTHTTGVDRIVKKSRIVIYLGTNMNGTACGYLELWDMLCKREILDISVDRKNTLIVYGPQAVKRDPVPEEQGGRCRDIMWFDTSYPEHR
jgi:hypothetical protein